MKNIIFTLLTASNYGLSLPFTGDPAKLGVAAIVMGVALALIIVLVVSMRRK